MSHPGWLALNSAMIANPLASTGGSSGKTNPLAAILIAVIGVIILVTNVIRIWTRRRRDNHSLTRIDDPPGSR